MARKDEEPARREVSLVRIFLSSPGDVADERTLARQLIDGELPKLPSLRGRLALELIAWDDPAAQIPMLATETPQQSVNAARPRPATCDIVIVILWSRLGTPLPDTLRKANGEPYLSGTEWEYEDAVNSAQQPRPEVLVYRRTEEPMISLRDPQKKEKEEQFERVEAFFARLRSLKRGINEYAALSDFKTLLRQNLEEMLYRRLQPSAGDVEPAPTTAEIPNEYYDWLRRSLEKIELLGAKEGRAVTLNHVYVPALTQSSRNPITLLGRLDQESLYVSAPAGAGKSTFCRWAVLQSIAATDLTHPVPAPEEFTEPVPANLRTRLPLLVPLREFWRSMNCGRGERTWHRADLEKALADWIDRAQLPGVTGALLRAHLNVGGAFLVFDGLDEVPVTHRAEGMTTYPRELLLSGLADALPDWRKKALWAIQADGRHRVAGNRFLLTSRPYGLDEAGLHRLGLPSAPLEPLPQPLQDLFVARWFHTLGKAEQTPGLIETIRGRGDVAPLAENPMLLTALCVLYDSGGRLPEDRYQLYKSIVGNVLHNRYPGDARERDPVERRLEAIAHGMHTGECAAAPRLTPAAEISWVEAERLLARFAELNPVYERDQVEAAVRREDLLKDSGLLVPRPNDRAAFYHLSFQEFLAAQRLARTPDDIEMIFRERADVPEWRPTLLFLFAAQIANWDAQWGLGLVGRLIKDQDRAAVKANPAPALFITDALDLCLAKKYSVSEELKEDFRRLALDAIEDEVELVARQALGLCLGRLGDPRLGWRSPGRWIELPSGSFEMGAQKQDPKALGYDRGAAKHEAPVHRVSVDLFRIARFQVTVAEFAEFLDDEDCANPRWWQAGGGDEDSAPNDWEEQQTHPSRPVVNVSWYQAMAFCAWLSARLARLQGAKGEIPLPAGQVVRLPSEAEWEYAARGQQGRRYPWGNEQPDAQRANLRETNIGHATPVGIFPGGATPNGVMDMAGNVVEWCLDPYVPDFYSHCDGQGTVANPMAPGDTGLRVLRGGSWDSYPDLARSADRDRKDPSYRSGNVGFRVVCSSSIKEH